MSEWGTYRLSDFVLFSPRTWYRMLELYNRDVWPLQIAALVAGLAVLVSLHRDPAPGRWIAALLGVCWLWVAWAFHLERYASINWAATWLAAGFAIEALMLLWSGVVAGRLRLGPPIDAAGRSGIGLLALALFMQPLIAPLSARPWTQAEVFGIAPDPTVVATLGILLLAPRPPWLLLIFPVLWCAVSGLTLLALGAPEAALLPVLGTIAVALTAWRARRAAGARAHEAE